MESIEIKFTAKTVLIAAKKQQELTNLMKSVGYQFKEAKVLPDENGNFEATMTLVRNKKGHK